MLALTISLDRAQEQMTSQEKTDMREMKGVLAFDSLDAPLIFVACSWAAVVQSNMAA